MTLSEITIGSLLEIYIRRDGYNYKVISKIEYTDEKRIGVTPIASRRMLFRFRQTDMIDIVYRSEDKIWKWNRVKAGIATMPDGTKLHFFEPSAPAEKFNRRTTYRLSVGREIDMRYEVIDEMPESASAPRTPELSLDNALKTVTARYREIQCRAYLKDISEGGAAVSTDVILRKGDIVIFEVTDGKTTVKLRAVVVRVRLDDEKSYFKHHYGLSFVETGDNFVPFLFEQQRKRLAEGKE